MVKFVLHLSPNFQDKHSIKSTAKINMNRSPFFKSLTKSRKIPNYTLIDFAKKWCLVLIVCYNFRKT